MLSDHGRQQERWASLQRRHRELANAYGHFIAELAPWDWFVNPFSFRDEAPSGGPPVADLALSRIAEYLMLVQKNAGKPIGWMIAEEFGRLGGRWHCHALIAGVKPLSRKFWWREAYRRFGRTRIEPFDPARGAAFYAAKYAAKQVGKLHWGGTLAGCDLSKCELPASSGGGQDRAFSAEMEKVFYRLGLGKWHR